MKKQNISGFATKIAKMCDRKRQFPINGQLELTYRCNLNCIHCYCKEMENKGKELNTKQWKKIIDELQKEGCLDLCFTGGDPLIRKDFLEIYAYAKAKGFLITILTNGTLFTKKLISYLQKSPPFSIEITLNGITEATYERITQIPGSFDKVMDIIDKLSKKNFHLVLKSNCLKENKDQIGKVKAFTHQLFGRDKKRFKYGPFIFPRLNGDKAPCDHRLSPEELLKIRHSDSDMWQEYKKDLCEALPKLKREKDYLYHCNSWMTNFFITPYGRLKFCALTDNFSTDLKKEKFREGFYNIFPRLLYEKFKTKSECRNCRLRPVCYQCPGRAYLETGDEEAPVQYYCKLAKAILKDKHSFN